MILGDFGIPKVTQNQVCPWENLVLSDFEPESIPGLLFRAGCHFDYSYSNGLRLPNDFRARKSQSVRVGVVEIAQSSEEESRDGFLPRGCSLLWLILFYPARGFCDLWIAKTCSSVVKNQQKSTVSQQGTIVTSSTPAHIKPVIFQIFWR